jgi:hypothetical protein
LKDEKAKAVISNDALLGKIKDEAAKAHAELIEAKGSVPKRMF